MRITSVDTYLVEIPFREPFVVWRGSIPSKQFVFVRITTDEGLTGWGEAAPFLFYAPETAQDVLSMIRDVMSGELIGRDPRDVRAIARHFAMLDGHEFAKAAVETALWDLLGKAYGLPVFRLLGGPVRDSVPLLNVLHSGEPAEMAEEARQWVDRGLTRLKLKIGFGIDRDEAMVAAVREAVGPSVLVRADAEESYERKDALKVGRRLERYDLELISQPVARSDWEGMAFLRQSLETPVLADEGIHSPHDVMTCVRHGASDMINIKVLKSGGALNSLAMAAISEAAHLPVVIGSMIEAGIGTLMGAHVAITLPGAFSTELCGPFLMIDHLLDTPMRIENGHLWLSDAPGLGAAVDLARLEQHQI
ncbi:MAG: mandelate racemase/muconate lactonizing enzyme family protein [Thermomicrobiales bacterium]